MNIIQARADLMSGVDTFYLLFAGALVYFMQIGFAMLCAGSIREKNVKNILLWCLLDSSGGAFGFWSIGFALAYGGDDNTLNKTFVGNSGFFLATSDIDLAFWYAFKITHLVIQFYVILCSLSLIHRILLGSSNIHSQLPCQVSWPEPSQNEPRWRPT
jgi:ammonia channel protein AmtB